MHIASVLSKTWENNSFSFWQNSTDSRQTGSAMRAYLPDGQQEEAEKGDGGEGGQEEVEPEQEHS